MVGTYKKTKGDNNHHKTVPLRRETMVAAAEAGLFFYSPPTAED